MAEIQRAINLRDSGMSQTQIANAALEEGVHVVGLSVLSGSHVPLVSEVLERLAKLGLGDVPLVAGGIIPPDDEAALRKAGVAAVYTPKDYDLTAILADIVEIVERATREAA